MHRSLDLQYAQVAGSPPNPSLISTDADHSFADLHGFASRPLFPENARRELSPVADHKNDEYARSHRPLLPETESTAKTHI